MQQQKIKYHTAQKGNQCSNDPEAKHIKNRQPVFSTEKCGAICTEADFQ